ncbi:TPA: hypothetical protein N0F65_001394 [Lagenidium giganteum]|uniref:Uncharacterized protein n=1 Tax=Lagenidium giganteum TaxID=4803 RepID=A0AAV2Z195_9STRA|nr:TPA: hypothetical protein N0F65_001394 [Lagenidium giganteum]
MRSEQIAIEVYRLPLRQTLDEGGDAAQEQAGAAAAAPQVVEVTRVIPDTLQTDPDLSTPATTTGDDTEPLSGPAPTPAPASMPVTPAGPQRLTADARAGTSRQVVLVTRPSQRDIEQWTERATSTMIKSQNEPTRLPSTTSTQSNRWVLEYKPVVRHSGWLIKRGHSIRNFKRRLFCIIDHELVYHDSHDSSDVRGRIDLSRKSTVQSMPHCGFKFMQGSYQMILYAIDAHERDVWIKKLQECRVEVLPPSEKTTRAIEEQSNSSDKDPVVFSGWLRKRGQMVKSTKRRWFELTSTMLSYYSHPQGGTRKGSLEVLNAHVTILDTLKTGERHSFLVRTHSRNLVLHADSEEERSMWIAYLCAAAEGSNGTPDSSNSFASLSSSMLETPRACTCTPTAESSATGASVDGFCRRCSASFISKTEDALLDVSREVQLILASPYSPEGSTSASFIKEQQAKLSPAVNEAVRQFMSGLADYMIHNRMNELRTIGGNPVSASSLDGEDDFEVSKSALDASAELTERIVSVIYEQIEERVFYPLYRIVHDNITQQTKADSKMMNSKIEVLLPKSQAFFGIGPDSISSSGWASACAKLHDIDKVSLPYMKRAQLVACCKEIYNVYHQEHPTNPPMNADEFIPAFIYVLIHARLEDPMALKELVTFFDLGNKGEASYFVTCLEIALEYIRSLLTACTVVLDATKKLGIEFARHRQYTQQQQRHVVVVYSLIPDGQAEKSGLVHVGDVLVAVNGVPVYEMELSEITKIVKGVEGDVELCLLSMEEYEKRFGNTAHPTDSDDDDDKTQADVHAAID